MFCLIALCRAVYPSAIWDLANNAIHPSRHKLNLGSFSNLCGRVMASVRGSSMNLVRRPGSHAEGCYTTVFFVDDSAIKVFKRQVDAPPHHVKDVFYSEVEAYRHSAARCQICQYTQHFIDVKAVCRIEDEVLVQPPIAAGSLPFLFIG